MKIAVKEYTGTLDATDAVAVIKSDDWARLCNLCHKEEYRGGLYQGSETRIKCRDVREWLLSLLRYDDTFKNRY